MRNIEIKARVRDLKQIVAIATQLSGSSGEIIKQEDTFYNCTNGRLKLRKYLDNDKLFSTLVRYDRKDDGGPKLSEYDLLHFTTEDTEKSNTLHNMLSKCLGVKGHLHKERTLFMVDQTRVHIDKVKGLGDFMELEVVLRPEQTEQDGKLIADELMQKLGVCKEDLIEGAYIDLLLK